MDAKAGLIISYFKLLDTITKALSGLSCRMHCGNILPFLCDRVSLMHFIKHFACLNREASLQVREGVGVERELDR